MKKIIGKFFAGAAALGLTVSLAACNFSSASDNSGVTASACAYLAIDINPSVELLVRDGRIVSVKADNDDAGVLLSGENLSGLTVEEATEKIVALAEQLGYLTDGNKKVKITVLSDDSAEAKKVEDSAKAGAEKGSDKAEINSNPRAQDERTVKKLQEQDPELYKKLTPAKVRLIEAIMKHDPSMTYEKGTAMKVSELSDILDDLIDEYKDMVTDELEDKFEAAYEDAKADLDRRMAAVYGEAYLAAWDGYAAFEKAFDVIENRAESSSLSDADIETVMSLLGLTDRTQLEKDGMVTVDSVDEYLDKHFDDETEEDEEIEDSIEDILDKYDEDNYTLTEEDIAALSAAAGKELDFSTLEEAEDYLDELEDALEDLEDSIRLTAEQKAEIEKLKAEEKALKRQILEEMKAEIEAAKEEIKRQKAERLN